jgi:tetratricopeptide (TPR) repeat protein
VVSAGDRSSGGSADELVTAGEDALARGHAGRAFELLGRAAAAPVAGAVLHRLAAAYAGAARHVGRHAEVLAWIEERIAAVTTDSQAPLLVARLGVWRMLDTARVLELLEAAVAAARAAGDAEGEARALAHGAYAAYRRGEARLARDLAERAERIVAPTRTTQFHSTRTRMFAATAAGDLEAALELSIKARAMARELGATADTANESNNLAETYLELGCPEEARACAEAARQLAGQVGHGTVLALATVYGAVAMGEAGEIDAALAALDRLAIVEVHRFAKIDVATAHAFWLLERGAAGDARRAREVAEAVLEVALAAGADSSLTKLHASVARAHAREGHDEAARSALERARKCADRGDPTAQSFLALAAAEVLAAHEPARAVVLSTARARILRRATRREDPHAFCVHVRVNRRLLELSGGVPPDLPHAS